MNWFSKRLPWVLLAASATLFFLPLGGRALWNSDEGRYAEIAREMLVLKDWLSPHLNYVLYFEKPPLMYWLTAASLAVFGQNEFAARFWCAVFGVLTVGVVYLIGKEWKNERTGLLSGSILATSLGFFCLTQYLVLDMALTFWMALALYASARILQERPPERVRRLSDLLAVAVAGGFLTKGPIAFVFPVAVIGLTLAYTRLGVQARKISWQPAFILLLVLVSPWFVLVSLKHPFFLQFFFIHENISRFLTTVHHRTAPFYFFVPVLAVGFLPWSVFLPKVFIDACRKRGLAMKRDPILALLMIWSLFIFLFFSFSQSKLIGYLLPIFPALALLTGALFEEVLEEENLPSWMMGGIISLILIFIVGLVVLKIPQAAPLFSDPVAAAVRSHADILCLVLGISVFVLVGVSGMRQSGACLAGITLVQVLLLSTLSSTAPALDPWLSNRGLARVLALSAKPGDQIVAYGLSYEDVLQGLPFYAGRRIVIEGDPGELELGRQHTADADAWFLADPGAQDALRGLPVGTWVVTSDGAAKYLRAAGALEPTDLVAREGQLLLFRKVR
jgi:4-amino-4-deoxy-L-arabinose transferase-like glycosyltransferase